MFFRPTPSKLEQARQAARDTASAVAAAAGTVAESVAETAHSLRQQAPKIAASVGEAVSAKASSLGSAVSATASGMGGAVATTAANVGESLSGAREVVAAKVDEVRNRGVSQTDKSVEAAQAKAAATNKTAAVEAERATREKQKKAEAELASAQLDLQRQRADFERSQTKIWERAAKMDDARVFSTQQADKFNARHEIPGEVEVSAPAKVEKFAPAKAEAPTQLEVPVPAKASGRIEIANADDDFEYRVVGEKRSGSKLWLIIGAGAFIGAALVYFFTSRNGRRSRAAIKDRLAAVKNQAVDKVTGASDAASTAATEQIDTLAEAGHSAVVEGQSSHSLEAVPAYEEIALVDQSSDEVDLAPSNAAEDAAVEAYKPLDRAEIEEANVEPELDEPHNPNIFDKVAGIVGTVAGVAEHLVGEDKDGVKQTTEEIEAAAETAKHETKEEREASTRKKKK